MPRRRVGFLAVALAFSASIASRAHARALEALASSTCVSCAWSSALESMDVAAPRDVLDAVKRAERELAACGLGGFLDRLFELGGANASMDVVHAYTASQEFCSGTSEIRNAVEMRTRALAAAKRARILIDFIALHARACSAPIFKLSREDDASAVELLREMMSESYRVISSGLCYEDTTRLTSSIQGVIDTRRLAQSARRSLLEDLDRSGLRYMEDAFYNETVARDLTSAFAAYDICRSTGRWKSTVSDSMFDAMRAHYTSLDFILTGLSGVESNNTSGARTFAFLVNAAYDVLRSAESCREAKNILPGRYFVSNVCDAIMAELSLECGLLSTGLHFLDVYSRGHGSLLLSLEINEISRHIALCEAGNTTAKTSMFGLNERALVELIGGLEIIDASMVGCRRGRDDSTAASRLAQSLLHALRTFRERRCFFTATTGEASVAAAVSIPEFRVLFGDADERGHQGTRQAHARVGDSFRHDDDCFCLLGGISAGDRLLDVPTRETQTEFQQTIRAFYIRRRRREQGGPPIHERPPPSGISRALTTNDDDSNANAQKFVLRQRNVHRRPDEIARSVSSLFVTARRRQPRLVFTARLKIQSTHLYRTPQDSIDRSPLFNASNRSLFLFASLRSAVSRSRSLSAVQLLILLIVPSTPTTIGPKPSSATRAPVCTSSFVASASFALGAASAGGASSSAHRQSASRNGRSTVLVRRSRGATARRDRRGVVVERARGRGGAERGRGRRGDRANVDAR